MEPHTPLHRDPHVASAAGEWPMLLPSAIEMTPPDSQGREKERVNMERYTTERPLPFGAGGFDGMYGMPAGAPSAHGAQQHPATPNSGPRMWQAHQGQPHVHAPPPRHHQHHAHHAQQGGPHDLQPQWQQGNMQHFVPPMPPPQMAGPPRGNKARVSAPLQPAAQQQARGRVHAAYAPHREGQFSWQQAHPMQTRAPPQPTFVRRSVKSSASANARAAVAAATAGAGAGASAVLRRASSPTAEAPVKAAAEPTSAAAAAAAGSDKENDDGDAGSPGSLKSSSAITNYEEYQAYLQRQKRIPSTKAMVWSQDVEEAFMEGLSLIPRVGRRKITVGGRLRGRNELIADFIFKKTKQRRSRKQVSSHIQVLKHILKDDDKFMNLVADLPESDSAYENITAETFDEFIEKLRDPELASTFGGSASVPSNGAPAASAIAGGAGSPQARSNLGAHGLEDPPSSSPNDGVLATPRSGKPAQATSGNSTIGSASSAGGEPQGAPGPVDAAYPAPGGPGGVPHWFASQLATPPQRRGHHRRTQSASVDLASDKVVPASFRLALGSAPDLSAGSPPHAGHPPQHVFTNLIRPQLESPLKPKSFERIAQRFPHVRSMLDEGLIPDSAPIIHGAVNLDISLDAANVQSLLQQPFNAEVQFLVWGTAPSRLLPASPQVRGDGSGPGSGSGSNDGSGPGSATASGSGGAARHYQRVPTHTWKSTTIVSSMGRPLLDVRDVVPVRVELLQGTERLYVPFTSDFWAPFLEGFYKPDEQSNGPKKQPDTAIGAITVSQTIYFCPPNAEPKVAFVVLYEFERAGDPFTARTIFRKITRHAPRDVVAPGFGPHSMAARGGAFASPRGRPGAHVRIPSLSDAFGSPIQWRGMYQGDDGQPGPSPGGGSMLGQLGGFGQPGQMLGHPGALHHHHHHHHHHTGPLLAGKSHVPEQAQLAQNVGIDGVGLEDAIPVVVDEVRVAGEMGDGAGEGAGDLYVDSLIAPVPTAAHAHLTGPATAFDTPTFQRSMSTVNVGAPSLMLTHSPLAALADGPLSATEPTDFAALQMMEGERIQRSMTAFDIPASWQEPVESDWYLFD